MNATHAKLVRIWAEEYLPPFAWQRVLLRLLPDLKKEGYYFHQVKDDTLFSYELLQKFQQTFLELYEKDMFSDQQHEIFA